MILRKFLFLKDFEPHDSYKNNSYKKYGVWHFGQKRTITYMFDLFHISDIRLDFRHIYIIRNTE